MTYNNYKVAGNWKQYPQREVMHLIILVTVVVLVMVQELKKRCCVFQNQER